MYKINNKNAGKLEKDACGILSGTGPPPTHTTQKPLAAEKIHFCL